MLTWEAGCKQMMLTVRALYNNFANFKKIISANQLYSKMSTKSALIILAAGAEEMELTITVDVLRRAGINVLIGGLEDDGPTKCSRDMMIKPDCSLADTISKNKFDCIILPGGLGGSKKMAESKLVGEILRKQQEENKMIAAICAAPTALLSHSIGLGKELTSYPSVKDQLIEAYKYVDDKIVVQDGQLITSRGPGTAFDFALKIAENLVGEAKAEEVAKGMLWKWQK